MAKTKEQLNSENGQRRHSLKMKRRNSCIESFANLYNNTLRFQWDRDFLNEKRKEVWESDAFQVLPGTWRAFVRGAEHILSNQFENKLVWTHIHPKTGKRVRRHHKSLEKFYHQINSDWSCFCYELEADEFLPIDKKHRELDKVTSV